MNNYNDIQILRDLATKYLEIASLPIMQERRELWSRHNSLKSTRPLVLATYGMYNVWCRDIFNDSKMECIDPFYREFERWFKMHIFHHSYNDDFVFEPWVSVGAVNIEEGELLYGVDAEYQFFGQGSTFTWDPPIKEWSDLDKIKPLKHKINEKATQQRYEMLENAIGDIITVDRARGSAFRYFRADISTNIVRLRGLEQLMIDMYESPKELHQMLSIMQKAILEAQDTAEKNGDYSLSNHENQDSVYSEELEWPKPNSGPRKRKDLWYYCAAQEFTLISPDMHDEFMLQYQLPIVEKWGLSAYGCCEDLTRKIDILRKIKNLRQIAVAPTANVAKCAEQIGKDYVISWRPNPSDMICMDFNKSKIKQILKDNIATLKGTNFHIHLKDIETVQGEYNRFSDWVQLVRDEIE